MYIYNIYICIYNIYIYIYIYISVKRSSSFKPFSVCVISSYFHCLLPRFKGSHQANILRASKETLARKSFSFFTLFPICNLMLSISFMSLINFLQMLSYLFQLKIMNFIFYYFFLTIVANFHMFLKITPLSGVYTNIYFMQILLDLTGSLEVVI